MEEVDDIPDISPEYGPRDINWMKPGESLPEVLDPVVTKALIQQFVEVERNRNRRALLWISSIFLFVVLFILASFLSIGIYVLRKSVAATEVVEDMTLQTSAYAAEVVDMSNKLGQLEEGSVKIKSELAQRQAVDQQKEQLLKSDLVRFGKWVATKNKQDSETLSALERKIKELEAVSEAREKELSSIKMQYSSLLQDAATVVTYAEDGAVGNVSEPVNVQDGVGTDGQEVESFESPTVTTVEPPPASLEMKPADDSARLSGGAISVVSFPNGDMYKGAFKNGLFNGWGVYSFGNGDRYEGDFENDMKNGKGTFLYKNGDKFIGEFRNDMKHGQGTFYFNNGERYVGEFLNNEITGKGTMFYNNRNKYEGDFKNGLRNGNGVLTFENGDIYKGEFRDDQRTGNGSYFFTDGSKYIGGFENGRRQGKGRYVYASGEEFVGEFMDGRREGVGVCIYPNGQRIKGLWKNDEFLNVVPE